MIIGEHKEIEKENIAGNFNSIEAGIDKSSMKFMFEMLSKSLYSNPIGSIVRELTSNCFDSHQEAKVDKAVLINFKTDEEGDYISFQDFGVGLSIDRIQKVYMNYFSSTKRETNEQIGGFGLGSKSPLSYTDYFYIVTVFNKIKYQYFFSKGETSPTLDLLDEAETEEENGTEVKIYIKNNNDRAKFRNELLSQLCYFDNVYFNNWGIDNNYKIYETNTFKYRNQDQYNDEMHIILGKVSYPISWNELNIKQVRVPIGIKFEIGELQVTPNRESIRYTNESKNLIKEKIEAATNELKDLYKDDTMLYDDYTDYLKNKDARPYILFGEDDKLYLTGLKESKTVFKPFYDLGIERNDYNIPSLLNKIYEHVGNIEEVEKVSTRRLNSSVYNKFSNDYYFLLSKNKQFINVRNLKFLKQDIFVKRKLDKYFVREIGEFVQQGYNSEDERSTEEGNERGFKYFNLGISIKAYKVYKILESMVEHLIIDYNQELTEEDNIKYREYLAKKNKVNIERKNLGKFPCKDIAMELYSSCNYNYIFQYDLQIENLNNYKGIIIYGYIEDELKLKALTHFLHHFKSLQCKTKYYCNGKIQYSFNTLINRPNYTTYMNNQDELNPNAIKIVRIAKNNAKHFKKKSMIHIDEFKSNNRIFRKLATVFKIEKTIAALLENQKEYRDNVLLSYFKNISEPLHLSLSKVYEYKDNFRLMQPTMRTNGEDYRKFKEEILELAESQNWFDPSIIDEINHINNWFKGVELIKFVEFNEKSLPFILKHLYDNKKKINTEYYIKYVRPEIYEGQLIIDFEPKEEVETGLLTILKKVA
jgi:hypothetical protein